MFTKKADQQGFLIWFTLTFSIRLPRGILIEPWTKQLSRPTQGERYQHLSEIFFRF